jgi:hypothetical protein
MGAARKPPKRGAILQLLVRAQRPRGRACLHPAREVRRSMCRRNLEDAATTHGLSTRHLLYTSVRLRLADSRRIGELQVWHEAIGACQPQWAAQ